MTSGIFINGRRPKSKKEIKESLANGASVTLEDTSLGGYGYSGEVQFAPVGSHSFVGPDPYTNRKFYGQIVVKTGRKVTVK